MLRPADVEEGGLSAPQVGAKAEVEAAATTRDKESDDEICSSTGKAEGRADASALGAFFHASWAELLAMEAAGGDERELLTCTNDRNALQKVCFSAVHRTFGYYDSHFCECHRSEVRIRSQSIDITMRSNGKQHCRHDSLRE